jgi:hypothetical protein
LGSSKSSTVSVCPEHVLEAARNLNKNEKLGASFLAFVRVTSGGDRLKAAEVHFIG